MMTSAVTLSSLTATTLCYLQAFSPDHRLRWPRVGGAHRWSSSMMTSAVTLSSLTATTLCYLQAFSPDHRLR